MKLIPHMELKVPMCGRSFELKKFLFNIILRIFVTSLMVSVPSVNSFW
jgi:K+-transporting ATPase A subunit